MNRCNWKIIKTCKMRLTISLSFIQYNFIIQNKSRFCYNNFTVKFDNSSNNSCIDYIKTAIEI